MHTFGIVIVDIHGDRFMELGNISVFGRIAEFSFEATEPALHVTVLPRAALVARTELYLHALAQLLVFVAEVFASLVAVQNCRRSVFAQSIKHGGERQLAAVPGAEPPADHLSGFEVEHNRQVVLLTAKLKMREVLRPGGRIDHPGVVHAILRSGLVAQSRVTLQDVRWRSDLCHPIPTATALLAGSRNDHASQCSDTSGFGLAPAKMNGQPSDAIERMLKVSLLQCEDRLPVSLTQYCRAAVVVTLADAQPGGQLLAPSRIDLSQDGYSFDRCISAVALPSSL